MKYLLQPNDQMFFLHIPKTAGMTLWHILKKQYGKRRSLSLTRDIRNSVSSHELAGYQCFRAHMDYRYYQHFPRKPIYITMLRHPVQHQLSRFGMKKRVGKLATIDARDIYDYLERVPLNIQALYLAGMKTGFSIDAQAALEVALTRLEECPFFGVMEQFGDSLELLSYTFGWPAIPPQKPRNTAGNSDKPELTPELTEIILEKCWLDLRLYEAGLEIFERRLAAMRADPAAGR